jgi:hypothetical protein
MQVHLLVSPAEDFGRTFPFNGQHAADAQSGLFVAPGGGAQAVTPDSIDQLSKRSGTWKLG